MRILQVKLGWIYHDGEEKKRLLAERRARFVAAGIDVVIDEEKLVRPTIAITERQYVEIGIAGELGMEILSCSDVGITHNDIVGQLTELSSKLDTFAKASGNLQYNERVEVYTPGMGLMLFNRTMLLSDACSDALQSELDNGWRIIAACPQPDQRRPDYILGRFEPDDEPGAGRSARRGR
jgi:hypothetical protein